MTSPLDIAAEEPPRDFHRRWPTLKPPLRPDATVVDEITALLAPCVDPVLLFGVTPELAAIDRQIIAVDWNAAMIAMAWPGDTDARQAVLGDWRSLPLNDASINAAIGDGALTMLDWPDEAARMIRELARVLTPDGLAVIRCFATPEAPEALASLAPAAVHDRMPFHEWRMRFNMAAARLDGRVGITSARLYEQYDATWPDRHEAIVQSDWAGRWAGDAMAEIDAYRGSSYVHSYPKRSEINALLAEVWQGSWHFIESHAYPGAEYCPLLVIERA